MPETIRAYKFYPARWGLDALYRRRLKLSTDRDINDPFEFLAAGLNQASRKEAKNIRAMIFAEDGIISFSETWSEPLLWSHYADNHRGLVLGFDLRPNIGHKIKYEKDRVKLPSRMGHGIQRIGESYEFWGRIRDTKFDAWGYEREVRVYPALAGSLHENGLFFRNFEDIGTLKEVIIGADFYSAGNKELMEALQKQGVGIKTARLAFRSFNVIEQNNKKMQKKL